MCVMWEEEVDCTSVPQKLCSLVLQCENTLSYFCSVQDIVNGAK